MQRYLYGVKQFLVAHGYTVVGSSDGTTGALDGVDRWASPTNIVRGGNASVAQSWIILKDANNVEIMLDYQGPGDDSARLSFSPSAAFVLAGTPTFQPTATDECVTWNNSTIVDGATSLDRIWNGWVDSTSKSCRFMMFRNNICVGAVYGFEAMNHRVQSPSTFVPASFGWSWPATSSIINNGTQIGFCRLTSGGVPVFGTLFFTMEWWGVTSTLFTGTNNELQGVSGYPILYLGLATTVSLGQGKIGMFDDMYQGRTNGTDGDTYGTLQWVGVGGMNNLHSGSSLWPWDGVSTPVRS